VASLTVAVNLLGVGLERWSLRPASGELVLYRESSFGRIAMIRDKELYTAFVDGKPALSGENVIFAEEAAHYALSQTEPVRQILLVSAEAGIVDEVRKYRPDSIDYAEIDPALSRIGLAFGFMRKQPGLTLINDDARAFLKRTRKTYDAVLVNYPMPKTFQTNRYFTLDFMRLAKTRLRPGGVLGFSVEGYESYISEPARKRVSSLHNTALSVFTHVLVLPGQKIYFVASDAPLSRDITGLLAKRGIRTSYISGYYVYDISDERVGSLMKQMESKTPMNTDFRPFLMKLSYEEWFMKYSARPWLFIIAAGAFFIMSMLGMNRDEFALFSTGFVNMGGELLTIFLFQILYGFLYLKIGIIVTVFLAGLIPGAWLGGLIKGGTRKPIIVVDCLMSLLLFSLLILLVEVPQVLPEVFFYVFAFVLSVLCGIEFPLVAGSGGDGNMTAARAFSVDLVGAAFGGFILSVVLIPYEGILFACTALILIKLASIIMQVGHGTVHQENIPTL
ncbi:MAG TPA: hypothetical protein VMU10_08380, partial [Desulfomonilia bacterium]|nr:hypothetical protein [Desulfomonilia bacterium]